MDDSIRFFSSELAKLPKSPHIDCALIGNNKERVSRGYFFSLEEGDRYIFHPMDNSSDDNIASTKELCSYPNGAFGAMIKYEVRENEKCSDVTNPHWHMILSRK